MLYDWWPPLQVCQTNNPVSYSLGKCFSTLQAHLAPCEAMFKHYIYMHIIVHASYIFNLQQYCANCFCEYIDFSAFKQYAWSQLHARPYTYIRFALLSLTSKLIAVSKLRINHELIYYYKPTWKGLQLSCLLRLFAKKLVIIVVCMFLGF